jgi:phosphoenolpyruvate-protein phosphotransferase
LAVGRVHAVPAQGDVPTWSVPAEEIEGEIQRLRAALAATADDLLRRQRIVAAEAGEKDAEILAVHRMLLQDPGSFKFVEGTIRDQRVNAEAGVKALIERFEATLGKLEGDSVRNYAADVSDPWRSVLETLTMGERKEFLAAGEAVVLAASELTPKVVTFLERSRILAVITETGGRYSHGAVLARAFGVPCVVGLPNLMSRLERGMVVTVDGDAGEVQLQPGELDLKRFRERMQRRAARRQGLDREASEPACLADGQRVAVQVNIESLRDLDMFSADHTDGIGLLRTEFLYMERAQFPSEDEQFRLYRRALEHMGGRPVTLRTLDIGGDKQLPYFKTPRESNPALGWRGLRISLEWQDLFRVQLRAALRAGVGHPLRILLPMVASLEEVRAVHAIFDGVRRSLLTQGYEVEGDVPVGMMVEVPSVLFALDELMREVDFVSVGTNDLVQYLLAADRDNPWVARYYEPAHPAVLRALARVAAAALERGIPSSVCGDVASDPAMAIVLFGMGFASVSVSPHFVSEVKYAVRRLTLAESRVLAVEAAGQSTADGVRAVLSKIRDRVHGD